MARITNIQLRGGTAAQWSSSNPVLAAREVGVETDTLKMKVGNGSSNWANTPFFADTDMDVSNLWKSPYFLPSTNGANGLGTLYTGAEVIPAGNAAQLAARDHIGLDKYPIMAGDKFVIEYTGKSILGGTLSPNVGVWMYTAAGVAGVLATHGWNAYDSASGGATKLYDLTNGFARYRRVHTIPNSAGMAASATPPRLGSLYFQLGQFSPYTDAWIISDVTMRRVALDAEIDTVSASKVTGLTKTSVGLANVDNTSDAAKPISSATQTALNAKANLASPTFTGTVTLPSTTNGLGKANVGLGNVDNTADSAKPVSVPVQAALDQKVDVLKLVNQEYNFDVERMSGPVGPRINVPTHISNPGEAVHPSVLFFPDGWGRDGWRYWMAFTPYPGGNDNDEDPCLVVSNNGISWQVPAGVTNPLADASGLPEYHSDTDLKMGPDGTMYLMYRWASSVDNGGTEEQFRYFSSKDGVTWSGPTTFHITDQDVTRIMSPSFVYENDKWTMWGVEINASPNKVIRRKTLGSTLTSGWGPIEYPTHDPVTPGKEPWHIYMLKHGGKYFGLMSTCDLNLNGANGDLHFMQSYDGYTFESSSQTVIPMVQPGEHEKLYRSCFVPAVENGIAGFRVWYSGWLTPPVGNPIWNLYRTFLAPGGVGNADQNALAYDTPLSPAGWSSTGQLALSGSSAKAKVEYDITVSRTGSTVAMDNSWLSLGAIIPVSMRVKQDTVARYYGGWMAGAGFNLPIQIFVNWYTGVMMIRQQSGTAVNLLAGVFFQLTGELFVDPTMATYPAGPYPAPMTQHSHPPASTTDPGFMPAADKAKLDAATDAATAGTLVLRDANGRFDAADPVATGDVATKGYVDTQVVAASGAATAYAPLSPTGWTNTGSLMKKVNGAKTTIDIDIVITKPAGAANLSVANAFVSCGVVIPTALRTISGGDTRYWSAWVAGAGFNLPIQIFLNMNSGELMIRQQSGTAVSLPPGVTFSVSHPVTVDTSNLP